MVLLSCAFCKAEFFKQANDMKKKTINFFCNPVCAGKYKTANNGSIMPCGHCGKNIFKINRDIRRAKNKLNFCSYSCSATYHNTHKKYGTKRSKLEVWLEEQLIIIYPNLEIKYNCVDIINSELDFFIPSINLAFELNGIFHYEPIFGADKLQQTKNNDERKFQACLEHGIELCIIDVSSFISFKPQKAGIYLDIFKSIIDTKLAKFSDSTRT